MNNITPPRQPEPLIGQILGFLLLCVCYYEFGAYTHDDVFHRWSLGLSLYILLNMGIDTFIDDNKSVTSRLISIFLSVLMSLLFGYMIVFIAYALLHLFEQAFLLVALRAYGGKVPVAGVIALFLIAALAYGFRLYFRGIYGLIEIFTGLSIIYYKLAIEVVERNQWGVELMFTILTAGVYLIVRGMDNLHHGYSDDKLLLVILRKVSSAYEKFLDIRL